MSGKRWTLKWDCCQSCGTTETPHEGHGLCLKCFGARNPRQFEPTTEYRHLLSGETRARLEAWHRGEKLDYTPYDDSECVDKVCQRCNQTHRVPKASANHSKWCRPCADEIQLARSKASKAKSRKEAK